MASFLDRFNIFKQFQALTQLPKANEDAAYSQLVSQRSGQLNPIGVINPDVGTLTTVPRTSYSQPTAPVSAPVSTTTEKPVAPTVVSSTPTPTQTPTQQGGLSGLLGQLEGLSPEQKQLLGLSESPEQQAQREGMQASLQKLITLQEQLANAGAPSESLNQLDQMIAEQQRAFERTTPSELFRDNPTFAESGITQGQLGRVAAAQREPIARGLSDLLFSRSVMAQQQQAKQQTIQTQIQGIGSNIELQKALAQLSPTRGLPSAITGKLLESAITSPQDQLKNQLIQAQISNLRAKTAQTTQATGGIGGVAPLSSEQVKVVSAIESVFPIIDQISEASQKVNTSEGLAAFLKGTLRKGTSALQLDPDAQRLQRQVGKLSFIVRALGEVGTLNEGDIQRAIALIPTVTDSRTNAQNKLDELRGLFNDILSTKLQVFQSKGTNLPESGGPSFQDLEDMFSSFIVQ